MPVIGLWRRSRPEMAWGAFAAANVAAMALAPGLATIPFHFVWISLMVVYGRRLWSPAATALVLWAVVVATSFALVPHAVHEGNWVEITEVPLMAGVFGVMVVYARRRQSALEAVRASAEKQLEFVRDASHQLRTPITVARGHTELLSMELAGTPHADDIAIVLGELETLSRMSQNLLVLDRAVREHTLDPEPIDLHKLLHRAGKRWAVVSNREWRVGAPDGASVVGCSAQLEIALDALIENAVAATRDGDEISLFARIDRAGVVIEVSDSGPGIPPEHAERIFDRFYRLESSPPGGSGLGLSIVRTIAESYGGGVTVGRSRRGGAMFELTLPRPVAA